MLAFGTGTPWKTSPGPESVSPEAEPVTGVEQMGVATTGVAYL